MAYEVIRGGQGYSTAKLQRGDIVTKKVKYKRSSRSAQGGQSVVEQDTGKVYEVTPTGEKKSVAYLTSDVRQKNLQSQSKQLTTTRDTKTDLQKITPRTNLTQVQKEFYERTMQSRQPVQEIKKRETEFEKAFRGKEVYSPEKDEFISASEPSGQATAISRQPTPEEKTEIEKANILGSKQFIKSVLVPASIINEPLLIKGSSGSKEVAEKVEQAKFGLFGGKESVKAAYELSGNILEAKETSTIGPEEQIVTVGGLLREDESKNVLGLTGRQSELFLQFGTKAIEAEAAALGFMAGGALLGAAGAAPIVTGTASQLKAFSVVSKLAAPVLLGTSGIGTGAQVYSQTGDIGSAVAGGAGTLFGFLAGTKAPSLFAPKGKKGSFGVSQYADEVVEIEYKGQTVRVLKSQVARLRAEELLSKIDDIYATKGSGAVIKEVQKYQGKSNVENLLRQLRNKGIIKGYAIDTATGRFTILDGPQTNILSSKAPTIITQSEKASSKLFLTPSAYEGTGQYERTGEVSAMQAPEQSMLNVASSVLVLDTMQDQAQKLKTRTKQRQETKQELKPMQAIDLVNLTKTQQKPLQVSELLSKTQLKQDVKLDIKPTGFAPLLQGVQKELKKQKTAKDTVNDLFGVYKRVKGKDVLVGEEKTKFLAEKKLAKELKIDLSASGFIEKEGKKVKADLFDSQFRASKVDPFRVVQKRSFRLGTGAEIFKIQKAKKSKSKKPIKWLR